LYHFRLLTQFNLVYGNRQNTNSAVKYNNNIILQYKKKLFEIRLLKEVIGQIIEMALWVKYMNIDITTLFSKISKCNYANLKRSRSFNFLTKKNVPKSRLAI